VLPKSLVYQLVLIILDEMIFGRDLIKIWR